MGLLRDWMSWASRGALRPSASGESIAVSDLNDPRIVEFLTGGRRTNSGAVVTDEAALRVAAAWRCVHIIAGAIATLPLDLIERVSENVRQPAVNNPMRALLTERPNDWQTPGQFRRMLQAWLLLRGNAYALKVTSGRRIVAMIPLNPDRVRPVQAADLTVTYVYTPRGGGQITLPASDIFHLAGLTLDGFTGLSAVSYARESLGLALQMEEAGARLFKQGTLVNKTVEHPTRMSGEAYTRLKASIEEQYAGVSNAHKTMILEEGAKFSALTMSAEDAQFLAGRDFQRYDIAMFFGVPPHMLGATEKTTSWGSGIEQMSTGFVQYTLQDWMTIWSETIKRDLLGSAYPTVDAKFFTAGLLRGDAKTRWATYVSGLQWGVLSPDDVRASEDMNPRPDGEGGEYYDPPNTAGGATSLPLEDPSNDDSKPA